MKNLTHTRSVSWFGHIFADTEGEEPPITAPPPDGGPYGTPEPPLNSALHSAYA